MTAYSTYHSLLRIASAVVALSLLFMSGIVSQTTADLTLHTEWYLANATVGVTVGVPPNEVNQITAAMTARQYELDKREEALASREIAIGLTDGSAARSNTTTSTFVLASLLFMLLVLIVLNYVLDYLRGREQAAQQLPQVS